MWELLTGEEPYAGMRSEEIIGIILFETGLCLVFCWCLGIWIAILLIPIESHSF